MINKLLAELGRKYDLNAKDVGEFSKLKAKGMRFTVQAYDAKGLGHVSVMRAKGLFGLVRMDTMMIVPQHKDLPLYSYDRIYAMGNDVLIAELYDTMINKADLSALDDINGEFAHITERDPGEHWYDSIRLGQSVSKQGKKENTKDLDELTFKHFCAYLNASASEVEDTEKKKELSASYVDGLLEKGGPSTDIFKKAFGEDKTARLFCNVLFGTK